MTTRANDRQQAERLARAFARDIQREQSVTAAIVAELGATAKESSSVGGPALRTAEQVAADCGLHLVDLEGGAVLLINGRHWR